MHSIDGLQVDTFLQEQFKVDGEDQVDIAKVAGFSITSEDWTTHRQNLSDEDLEAVAGEGVVAGAILSQPRRAATDPITSSCSIHQSSCSYRLILESKHTLQALKGNPMPGILNLKQ